MNGHNPVTLRLDAQRLLYCWLLCACLVINLWVKG